MKVGAGVLSFALLLGMAPTVFAQTDANSGSLRGFCDRIDQVESGIKSRISTHKENLVSKVDVRKSNVEIRFDERMSTLAENREMHDENRADRYTKLSERATTEEQKAAVADFQTDVEALVVTRKAAVDTAIQAFKDGVIALYSGKRSEAELNLSAFDDAVDAAISEARASCTSGTDSKVVRDTLSTEMKNSRANLKAARESIKDSSQTELTKLREARKASIQTAVTAYQTALEKEKKDMLPWFQD